MQNKMTIHNHQNTGAQGPTSAPMPSTHCQNKNPNQNTTNFPQSTEKSGN